MKKTTAIRVLTFNVFNVEGDPARQAAMRDGIAALQPDLVALQEIARTDEHDQLADLLSGTDLHGFHQNDLLDNPQRTSFEIALASRWKPSQIELAVLPGNKYDIGPRYAIGATIPLPGGPTLPFISAVTSWRLDAEADRLNQVHAIAQFEGKLRSDVPTILAGDFNAGPEADSIRYLTGQTTANGHSTCFHDAWTIAGDGGPGHTWTTRNPLAADLDLVIGQPGHARRIDYIFVGWRYGSPHSGGDTHYAACVRKCEVVFTNPPISDHYGVLATIEITG
ncbi:endonuclease/exonuclease/phosphatase family protein [Amycolatopsis pithecellobii]|uniref:Endonuclease/exonuclease/phosphatase family protein n=1 Tax=Amycolatopsis pithecellobii TaxID=664692 RepID=A0A6N7YQV9_9PSEU|nr:endonuclease/exonuclease/phosphatase family protein [Amycolatopsis pithecellobii]MTD54278.1 endonuclease/exonuclease/phosphatase family protein [Amycolatopsis pithecellobii]